jgi:hypothetical protein
MFAMDNQLNELRALAAHAENRRTETGIPRVAMVKGKIPEHMLAAVYDPMINVILQGSKSMTVGDRTLRYDPATYFVMSIDLPAVGSVHPAETGEPYLAVSLTLDPTVLSTLFADLPKPASRLDHTPGFSVASMTTDLMDAWVRMLRLMGDADAIAALAPVYEREIISRASGPPWLDVARDRGARQRDGPCQPCGTVDPPGLRPAHRRRALGRAGVDEHLGLPPPLQGRDQPEPVAVSETRAPAPGQNTDGGECEECHGSCLRGRL